MTRKEAAWRLRKLAHDIYDLLEDMEEILREAAPEELETAKTYWMAHIDRALLNLGGWVGGGSLLNLEDTLATLEEEEE